MSDGSEFQVCGPATENARRANSVRVLAADSIGASEGHRGRTGTADWIRSFRYAGLITLYVYLADHFRKQPRLLHQRGCELTKKTILVLILN